MRCFKITKPNDQLTDDPKSKLKNKAISLVTYLFEDEDEYKVSHNIQKNIDGDICVFITNNKNRFKLIDTREQ